MADKGRHNPYFDFLRGLAIMMVVGIHTFPKGIGTNGAVDEWILILIRNWFNCAVPLFLAISGFFITRKKLDTFNDSVAFWGRQIPKVYIPCIIFSLPWFVISCISVDSWGGVILRSLNLIFCGYSVYYFIALIIECYLLAPILVKHNNVKTLIIVVMISLLSTIGLEYLRFVQEIDLPLIVRGSFPILLIFFYIGIYLSKHNRDYPLWLPIGMMLVGMVLGLFHMNYLQTHYNTIAVGQKSSLYLFDLGFILLCMSKKSESLYRNSAFNRIILFIGEISFGVYFTHVYLIAVTDRFFPYLHDSWILSWAFSLILTIAIIIAVKRIAPKYAYRFLGYR